LRLLIFSLAKKLDYIYRAFPLNMFIVHCYRIKILRWNRKFSCVGCSMR